MKVIVAGSRTVKDYKHVAEAIRTSPFLPLTEVVSGRARGADKLGEMWAKLHRVHMQPFPAGWRDVEGVLDPAAGAIRNQKMAEYADALIVVQYEGEPTDGTADMIKRALRMHMPIHYHWIKE